MSWRSVVNVLGVAVVWVSPATIRAQQSSAPHAVATRDGDEDARRIVERLFAHRVTVDLRQVSRKEAIDALAMNARVPMQYRMQVLNAHPGLVTLQMTNGTLGDALDRVLNGTGLSVIPDGSEGLLITEADTVPGASGVATGTIVGTITDSASGRRLSGVTVKLEGMKLSAISADSGRFVLHGVPVGDRVLSARFFGYRPVIRTVTVSGGVATNLRIAMVVAPSILSGVVTTATGMQRKVEVGNDITTLNVDSIRQVAPITSVTDILESRVPGLTVLHSSGTPGDGARLRLRGAGSITGNNDPIVIVDGIRVYAAQSDPRNANLAGSAVQSTSIFKGQELAQNANISTYTAPSPLDQIDPNSIETIEVFKGPSASALYGADAANGVIVITTKQGHAGPMQWSATARQGLSYYPGKFPVQILRWGHNTHDGGFFDFVSPTLPPLCDIAATGVCNVVDSVTHLQVLNSPYWSPVGHGTSTSGSVSVSGGTSTLTYNLTGSAGSELGYLHLPDAMADAFKAFHGYDVPGWARRPDKYPTWGGSGQLAAQVTPLIRLTFIGGLFHDLQQRSSLEYMLPMLSSTIDTITGISTGIPARNANAYERSRTEHLRFTNSVNASWQPWSGVALSGVAGLDILTGHDGTFLARDIVPYAGSSDTLGRFGTASTTSNVKTLNLATHLTRWGHWLTADLGINVVGQSTYDLTGQKDTLGLGITTPSSIQTGSVLETGATTYGWFFTPKLNFLDRYFLNPGFQLAGGNANGSNATTSLKPKVDFAWLALDRRDADAAPVLGILTLLRPHIALGGAPVQPAPDARLRLLSGIRMTGSSTSDDTLFIHTLGNTQLRPERYFEAEWGGNAEFWHNRGSVDFTMSHKMTHDAIVDNVPVASSVNGGGLISLNIGEVRNTSVELDASAQPIETSALTWSISGNMTHLESKVLKLNSASAGLANTAYAGSLADTRVAVGYPLFGRWSYPILGYADVNNDQVIEPSEIRYGDTAVYLGRTDPGTTAAFSTNLSLLHGRLQMNANFAYLGDYSQVNASANTSTLSAANELNATLGQQAGYVAAAGGGTPNLYGLTQVVSSWRFQSFSLNYALPTSIARYFRSKRASVALQGGNLALWTNYRGKDPDVNAYPNGNQVVDAGQLPMPRTWSIMLNLGN